MLITDNLFDLANAGAVYLRRLRDGRYQHCDGKANSTHRLYCTRPRPHIVKDGPRGVIRCTYDGTTFTDFPTHEEGRKAAESWLLDRKALALAATPTSAVAVPRGRSYKSFCAQRAKAAADGSLYDKKKNQKAMKKPAPPKGKAPAKSTTSDKDTKNGMTRPREGSTTRKVWDIADKLGNDRAAVLAECAKRKINPATAMTQYGKWRVYEGLAGTRAKAAKPATKRKPAPPAKAAKRKPAPPKRKPAVPVETPAPTAETA